MKHIGRSLLTLALAVFLMAGLYGCGGTSGADGTTRDDTGAEEPAIPPLVPVRVLATRQEDGAVLTDLRYTYDQYGNKTAEINYQFGLLPEGYYIYTYEYGLNGIPAKRNTYLVTQDRTRLTTIETFDSVGRVIGRQEYNNAEKRVFEYAYDNLGNEILYRSYDDTGRMISDLETTYDKDGQRLTEQYTAANGSAVHREYQDGLCSRRVETDALGRETEYVYTIKRDRSGNLLTYGAAEAKTGQLNFWKEYRNTYDEDGLLTGVEITDQNGECVAQSSYQYDQQGRVVKSDEQEFTGANEFREVWDITYNDSGAVVRREQLQSRLSSGGSWEESIASYQYDQDGLLTGFIYRMDGHRLSFTIGRVNGQPVVLKKDCSGPLPFTDFDLLFTEENDFTMDSTRYTKGDAAFSGNGSYTRVYTYKEDGRLSAIEETAADGAVAKQWSYTYQRPRNAPEQTVAAIPYNGGASAVSLYSDDDTLLSTVSFIRNDVGLYDQMTTWEGTFHFIYGLDEDGLTTGVRYDANGEARGSMTYDGHGNMVRELLYGEPYAIGLTYTYDAMGNQVTSYPWSSSATAYCAYAHDELGRCTGMMLYDGEERRPEQLLERYTYSYDREGRLSRMECRNIHGSLEGYILYQHDGSEMP